MPKIDKVLANKEGANIKGDGTVGSVDANANNITVKTKDTSVAAAKGTTGVLAGKTKVEAGKTEKSSDSSPVTTGGGSGGGSSSKTNVEILSKVSLGLPTSEVKVRVDGKEVGTFDLYFDGALLASAKSGTVVVASAVLNDLKRVQVKINNELKSDSDVILGSWS